MKSRMKAQYRAPQQSCDELFSPRADAERFRIRPWNVPEGDDRRPRQALAYHPRQQCEVIILDQNHRVLGSRFFAYDVGESPIDAHVLFPVRGAKYRTNVRDVAQRPQPLVGKACVIAFLFLRREPYPAQGVGRLLGRHAKAVVTVDGRWIRAAAAMRDPCPGAGAHDRLQCSDQSARGSQELDSLVRAHMDERLAVRHDQYLVAKQLLTQDAAQHLGAPGSGLIAAATSH